MKGYLINMIKKLMFLLLFTGCSSLPVSRDKDVFRCAVISNYYITIDFDENADSIGEAETLARYHYTILAKKMDLYLSYTQARCIILDIDNGVKIDMKGHRVG